MGCLQSKIKKKKSSSKENYNNTSKSVEKPVLQERNQRQSSSDRIKVEGTSITNSHQKSSSKENYNNKSKNDKKSVKPLLHEEKNQRQSSSDRIKVERTSITNSHQKLSSEENYNNKPNTVEKPVLHEENNQRQSSSVINIDDNIGCSDLHQNSTCDEINTCIAQEVLREKNDQLESERELFDTNQNTEQDIMLSNTNEETTEVYKLTELLRRMSITEYNTLKRREFFNISDEILRESNFETSVDIQNDVKTNSYESYPINEPISSLPENGNITNRMVIVDEDIRDPQIINFANFLDEERSENAFRVSPKLSTSSTKINIDDENMLNNNYENAEIQNKTEESICDDTEPTNSLTKCVYDTDKSWTPCGFSNPIGYCYLNSVVQSLASCDEFRKALANYEPSTENNNEDIIFVTGLCNLIRGLSKRDYNEVDEALSIIQYNCNESAFGDDIFKCFMNILTRISNVIGNDCQPFPNEMSNMENQDKAEIYFNKSRNKNRGFVFDNFYGQLAFQIVCQSCSYVCNESYQLMKSLTLPIPSTQSANETVTINMCLDLFFKKSEIDTDEPMPCDCSGDFTDKLNLLTRITHAPKYLFLYLNRGSIIDGAMKSDTFVSCEFQIPFETTRESFLYDLISVIDHVGTNECGHYYCKCCYDGKTWWNLNDYHVEQMRSPSDVVTQDSIGFIFKKHK